MKKNLLIVGSAVFMGTFMSSCSKEDNNTVPAPVDARAFSVTTDGAITTVRNLQGDSIVGMSAIGQPFGSGKFTFFSIERKSLVPNSDSATNRWDIGFRGTSIIINGGTSGPGTGGAFVLNGIFDDVKVVPADSVFRVDAAPGAFAIPAGSNRGWYTYNGLTQLVTPLPGKVLMIRTATGKYAKLEITNYYRGGVTPSATASDDVKLKDQRFFTFRFIYQPNGTKNF